MILELIEETRPESGTMYAVLKDGRVVKWFAHKEDAQAFYDKAINDPNSLEPVRNILQSQQIDVPLEQENNQI